MTSRPNVTQGLNNADLEKGNTTPVDPFPQVDTIVTPPRTADHGSFADDKMIGNDDEQDEVHTPREPNLSGSVEQSPYLVQWDGPDDPENPKNWSRRYRWFLTMASGLLMLNASYASSAPAGVLDQLIERFSLSRILATLTISLFVVGFCVGPLVWGPLSEHYGRRPILLAGFFGYTAFQVGSETKEQVLVFRFFGGAFAASPTTVIGAVLADLWDADTRGKAMGFFALAPGAGPALGPIISGYIDVGGASWRWLFGVVAIFAGLCFFLILFAIPETYGPAIQTKKAARKRKETNDNRWFSELEAEDIAFIARLERILARPFKILASEPMLLAITLYMSFIYGCLYLLFVAYPIVFTIGHHLNNGESGLMFLPIFIGATAGSFAYVYYFAPMYKAKIPQYAPKTVPPEQRLIPSMYGAPVFAISFFWFGWTSFPNISIWVPLIAGLGIGFSFMLIFMGLLNYLVDAYLVVAASAMASSNVVRSAFGAIFPLFASKMYEKLNPRWASTLLGCIALLGIPIPFGLYRFGPWIRRTSKYAPTFD
ncbi:hypothetical protein FS837_000007 [Tulasnella sp. UAMH 9824]|nr:hypothetical protein FS837_000007 [Tulasnella sp. UAMH 9824]